MVHAPSGTGTAISAWKSSSVTPARPAFSCVTSIAEAATSLPTILGNAPFFFSRASLARSRIDSSAAASVEPKEAQRWKPNFCFFISPGATAEDSSAASITTVPEPHMGSMKGDC